MHNPLKLSGSYTSCKTFEEHSFKLMVFLVQFIFCCFIVGIDTVLEVKSLIFRGDKPICNICIDSY